METMTDAQQVCADHVRTLEAFGGWIETFGEGAARNDVDLAGARAGWRVRRANDDDTFELARDCVEWMDENGLDELSWSAFAADVLDVEIIGSFDHRAGEWNVTDVALLVTSGGPTVRYHSDGSGMIRVAVSWWNDQSERVVVSSLADYLDELAVAVAE
jgi:hypothetical protein